MVKDAVGDFVDATVKVINLGLVAAVHVVDRGLPGPILECYPPLLPRGGIRPSFLTCRIVSDWVHYRGGHLVETGIVDEDGWVEALVTSLAIVGAPPAVWDHGVAGPASAVFNVVPDVTLQALGHRLATDTPCEDLAAARAGHFEPLPVQQIGLLALQAEIFIGAFGAS